MSHPLPSDLRAVSPTGAVYATVAEQKMCLDTWAGTQQSCSIAVPDGLDLIHASFSDHGKYLAVILTAGVQSTLWIVDVSSGQAKVLTATGLSADPAATPATMSVGSAVWPQDEVAYFLQLSPAAGAPTGDLMSVPLDGSAPVTAPIPADLAGGNPQLWAVESGILYAPNSGPAVGQLWWMDKDIKVTQVGKGSFSDGGTVLLVGLAPSGETAMICPAHNSAVGRLQEITLSNGDVFDYLDDNNCDAVAYSPDGKYLAVAGPVGNDNVVTVFENDPDSTAVLVSADLDGPVQAAPATMTWNADNLLTITPVDTTNRDARVNLVQLGTR